MGDNRTGTAIEVKNAFKSFGKWSILRGLSMNIPEGIVYGLLGPSGCGKTTLINALLGMTSLDAGDINVKYTLENIGYMPQSIALYTQFSIMEILYFYGYIYGMKASAIKTRTSELLSYLNLPSPDCVIANLSGGEERRVSLCVALLHNPQLLILDEPTVGVDPVLSLSIWRKLKELSIDENKTILITTHYIEEARHASKVGLMRNGRLIIEAVPSELISRQSFSSLEDAFLNLIQQQPSISQTEEEPLKKPKAQTKNIKGCFKISYERILALFLKNFCWMKRNICIVLFIMILPMVQCCLMNITIGRDPMGLSIAIVNDEVNQQGVQCEFTSTTNNKLDNKSLSCYYIHKLKNKKLHLVPYSNYSLAVEAVKKNKAWGLLHFDKNYSTSLLERMHWIGRSGDSVNEHSEVKISLDMSNQIIGNMLKRDIAQSFAEFLQDLYRSCGLPIKAASLPILFMEPIYGTQNPSFVHFSTPAVIILSEFYLPMMFTVGAVLMDKSAGNLERSFISGVTYIEMLIAHITIQYIVLSVQTFLMMVVLFYIFDNPMKGNIVTCIIILFEVGTTGMFYGLFVAVLCDTFTSATFLGLGSYFPLFVLSGMIWPLEGMHWLLRTLGFLLPLSLSIEALRGVCSRAWPLTHPTVYPGLMSPLAWSAVLLTATALIIRYRGLSNTSSV